MYLASSSTETRVIFFVFTPFLPFLEIDLLLPRPGDLTSVGVS